MNKSAALVEAIKKELRNEIRAEILLEFTVNYRKARTPWDDIKELVATMPEAEAFRGPQYYAMLNAMSTVVRTAFNLPQIAWMTPEQGVTAYQIVSDILQMVISAEPKRIKPR